MGDVLEAKAKLRSMALELDKRSKELAQTNRELEPVLEQYEDFIREFKVDLLEQYQDSGKRLPSSDMCLALALREMPAEFRKQYRMTVGKRDRLKQRIGDLKSQVDAWRSVLSADKTELEAIS